MKNFGLPKFDFYENAVEFWWLLHRRGIYVVAEVLKCFTFHTVLNHINQIASEFTRNRDRKKTFFFTHRPHKPIKPKIHSIENKFPFTKTRNIYDIHLHVVSSIVVFFARLSNGNGYNSKLPFGGPFENILPKVKLWIWSSNHNNASWSVE